MSIRVSISIAGRRFSISPEAAGYVAECIAAGRETFMGQAAPPFEQTLASTTIQCELESACKAGIE